MKSSGYTVGTEVKGHWKAIVIGADGFGDFPSFLPDPHALPNTQMPIQGRPPWMEGGTKGPLCPERSSVVRHWTHCLPFSMEASSCFCNNVGMFPFMFFGGFVLIQPSEPTHSVSQIPHPSFILIYFQACILS